MGQCGLSAASAIGSALATAAKESALHLLMHTDTGIKSLSGGEMDRMDELLLDWYEWQSSYEPALGYGRADASCRDFRISRQWMDYDDLDAAVEHNLKESIGKVVEPMILKLEVRHRLAINTAMRNFQAGRTVWVNPRYPETQDDDYSAAKAILCPKMVSAGLLEKSACIPRIFVQESRCGA